MRRSRRPVLPSSALWKTPASRLGVVKRNCVASGQKRWCNSHNQGFYFWNHAAQERNLADDFCPTLQFMANLSNLQEITHEMYNACRHNDHFFANFFFSHALQLHIKQNMKHENACQCQAIYTECLSLHSLLSLVLSLYLWYWLQMEMFCNPE